MEQLKRILEALPKDKAHVVIGAPLEILGNFPSVFTGSGCKILKYSSTSMLNGILNKGYIVRDIEFYKDLLAQEVVSYHQYEDLVSTKIPRIYKVIRVMKCQSLKQ